MTHLIDKSALVSEITSRPCIDKCVFNGELEKLRQSVQEKLIKASINYYEAERACCELVVPQKWKDDLKAAYDEFVCRCQDYQEINDSDTVDLNELNYDDYE